MYAEEELSGALIDDELGIMKLDELDTDTRLEELMKLCWEDDFPIRSRRDREELDGSSGHKFP